jgi:hypothetical protein
LGTVDNTLSKTNEFLEVYNFYSFLWRDNKKEHLSQFLLYNHVLTEQELSEFGKTIFSFPKNPATLEQFREKVDYYEKVCNEIKKLEETCVIDKWLRLNAKLLKKKLINYSLEWKNMYKNHVRNDVINSINEFDEFLTEKEQNFKRDIENANLLVDILKDLNDIRQKNDLYDNFFKTIDDILKFIKLYCEQLSQEVLKKLKRLPERWKKINKNARRIKRSIAPLKAVEILNVEKKILFCRDKEKDFFEKFLLRAPYSAKSMNPYYLLDYVSLFFLKI